MPDDQRGQASEPPNQTVTPGVMIVVSQEYLPSLGGKQVSVDRIARLTTERGIATVEIVTNGTDAAADRKFDASRPFAIHRLYHPLFAFGRRLIVSGKEGARFYGGQADPTPLEKMAIVFNACLRTPLLVAAVRRRLTAHRDVPVLLHVHDYTSLLAARLARSLDRVPGRIRIVFVNGSINRRSGFWMIDYCIKRILRACDLILCVSQASADALIEDFAADPQRTKAYRLWFDMRDVAGLDGGGRGYAEPLRVAFVGRVVPDKGIRDVMAIADRLDRAGRKDSYRLTVFGDSDHPVREELRRVVARSACLVWAGHVGKPELWRRLAEQDILFMPSHWAEGSGNAIVEAAACGLAVVAARVGGIPENAGLLPHHRLFERYEPDYLLGVFDDLKAELLRTGRPRVAEAQRRVVAEKFSQDNFSVHEDAYRALLADAAASLRSAR